MFEDTFVQLVEQSLYLLYLEMRPGGWKVKVTSSLVKLVLSGALMTGVLHAAGIDELPTAVLPAVLPLVVDMDRARLSRRDKYLLVQLRSAATTSTGIAVQPDVLYNKLPQDIREQVSPLDFRAFLDALIEVGEADDAGGTDIRLRPADHTAWLRITWE